MKGGGACRWLYEVLKIDGILGRNQKMWNRGWKQWDRADSNYPNSRRDGKKYKHQNPFLQTPEKSIVFRK